MNLNGYSSRLIMFGDVAMKKFFPPQIDINSQLDNLLAGYRFMRTDLLEGAACKLKYANVSKGVPLEKQFEINVIVGKINKGKFDKASVEIQLKLIDTLVLYANHLDQQTSDEENTRPPLNIKEEKVRCWLEAAWHVAQKVTPEIAQLLTDKQTDFKQMKPEVLSSVSMLLHYLGKVRRYNPVISVENRLPLLTTAVAMSQYLLSLRNEGQLINDPHYYSSRVATFEMPVVMSLGQLGRHDDAAAIMGAQLAQSKADKNYYHIIQGLVQLSVISRNKSKTHPDCIVDAIDYATQAIKVVCDESPESFKTDTIYYNARVALMNANKLAGNQDVAEACANAILHDYEQNSNCGAKVWHLKEAEALLATSTSTLAYS